MKKTLVLTHEYYPFSGGVARYVYNLFKFYPKAKYLVVTDNSQVKSEDNVINLKLKNTFLRPTWLISYFKLKKIIRRQKIEQIFTPNILPLGSLAYYLGLPYIISLHGLDINLALKNKPTLTQKILTKATYILVNSQSTAGRLAGLDLPVEKIKVMYPGVNQPAEYSEEKLLQLKQALKISDNDTVLLTVGRLNSRKAQDLVIRALAEIKNQPIKYLMVGNGSELASLQKITGELNLNQQVVFLTGIADSDLIYYYKLADIFVLPQRQSSTDVEGFGIVFLEAAAVGLPIIAGNSGGVKEIFTNQQNALLVEPEVKAVASAIELLLSDSNLAKRLGVAAKQRSAEFKTWAEQSLLLEKLL